MELNQIKYFFAVAETNNITKAAELLYITRSAVSKAISRLEEEIGVQLLDHVGNNRVYLNAFGKQFLESAKTAVRMLDDGVLAIRDADAVETGTITYSVPEPHLFEPQIDGFIGQHPNVRLIQKIYPQKTAERHLLTGDIDFAISYFPPADPYLEWTEYTRTKLFVIMSKDNPLAEKEPLYLADLKGQRFLQGSSCPDIAEMCSELCRKAGVKYDIALDIGSPMLIYRALVAGRGVALAPVSASGVNLIYVDSGTDNPVERELADESCDFPVGMMTVRNHYLSKATRVFMDYLAEYIKNDFPSCSRMHG